MALQLNIDVEIIGLSEPLVYEDGYAVISKISGRKRFYIDVSFLTDKEGSQIKSERFDFLPDLDGKNYHKQAYEYLKSLSKFKDSIDV
tara:strand:+ start:892 stop:1155 length:264 start_codon:yes stop_codon:yes gene_type:complete